MIFYFHPHLVKWSNLTNIFQMGWFNHQLDKRGVGSYTNHLLRGEPTLQVFFHFSPPYIRNSPQRNPDGFWKVKMWMSWSWTLKVTATPGRRIRKPHLRPWCREGWRWLGKLDAPSFLRNIWFWVMFFFFNKMKYRRGIRTQQECIWHDMWIYMWGFGLWNDFVFVLFCWACQIYCNCFSYIFGS